MKVRADCRGQRTLRRSRLSGSTVGSSDPVQVIGLHKCRYPRNHYLTSPFLKFVYRRGHVYHDACIEDKGWFVIVFSFYHVGSWESKSG